MEQVAVFQRDLETLQLGNQDSPIMAFIIAILLEAVDLDLLISLMEIQA